MSAEAITGDDPVALLRDAVESAGFTIEGLRDDMTREDVVRVCQGILQQVGGMKEA